MMRVLAQRYGEHLVWWGDTAGGVTMLVTQRADLKTWTILAEHDGQACMVSSGGGPARGGA